jgi:hypothetical protein
MVMFVKPKYLGLVFENNQKLPKKGNGYGNYIL